LRRTSNYSAIDACVEVTQRPPATVGAVACGFTTEPWALARVGALLEVEFGHVYSTTQVWRSPTSTFGSSMAQSSRRG
jgi:hypothetical protein